MTSDQFCALCRGTARLLQLRNADALFESADVRIDGVKMGVFRADEWDQPAVYCYVDLGSIESSPSVSQLMEEILALNLELDAGFGEVIGVERASRHLVLRARLRGKNGEMVHEGELAAQLRSYASLANELYQKMPAMVARPIQVGESEQWVGG